MAGAVKGIPDGSSVVIPRLFCRDVAAEIDFCKNTFDAVELARAEAWSGRGRGPCVADDWAGDDHAGGGEAAREFASMSEELLKRLGTKDKK